MFLLQIFNPFFLDSNVRESRRVLIYLNIVPNTVLLSVHEQEFSPSPGGSSSSAASVLIKSRTSLAEDINAIKHALEGASVSAREKTLKILERLTARLALAETERDSAMSKLCEEIMSILQQF